MKRLFSLTFLAVMAVLVASPAQATFSRVNALAGLSLYVEDNTNVFFLPQTLVQWQNQAYFEMMDDSFSDDDRFVGGNFHLPRLNFEAGVYVNMPTLTPSLLNAVGGEPHVDPGTHTASLYAKNQWGFYLSYGADSWKDDQAATDALNEESTSWFGVGGGYTFTASKWTSEIGLRIGVGSGETKYNGTGAGVSPGEESSFDLDVVIRNWYQRGRHGRFNAVVTFSTENASGKTDTSDPNVDTEGKLSGTGVGLGVGWEYPASNNVLVIAVLEPVDYVALKFEEPGDAGTRDETKVTNLVLPAVFLAVEAKIAGWLTGRVGATQSWGTETSEFTDANDDTNNTKITRGMSAFAISLGVGVEFGRNFWMDAVIDEQIFYRGPNFVTGLDLDDDLVAQLSIGGRW